jgi:hypothetical protein
MIQLHLVAESCTICSSGCRRLVRKLLDTPTYAESFVTNVMYAACSLHTWERLSASVAAAVSKILVMAPPQLSKNVIAPPS